MFNYELIEKLKHRLERHPFTDFGNHNDSLPPSASESKIELAELGLGFHLYESHRQLLCEVANGGFGPGYGLVGVDDGFADPDGGTLGSSHILVSSMVDEPIDGFAFAPL